MRSLALLVIVDSIAWVVVSLIASLIGSKMSERFLMTDTAITRPKRFERDGRIYRRLGVHRWKTLLPETNSVGPGERVSKRTLPGWAEIDALVAETRRAEYVHLMIALAGPLFLLWNPLPLGIVMVVFGIAFNAPFIMVQRYNRFRLVRVAARLRSKS